MTASAPAVTEAERLIVMPCTALLPTLEMMQAHLASKGWKRRPSKIDGLSLYILVPFGGEEIVIHLPDEATAHNTWQRRVEQALRTLAGVEAWANDAPERPIGDLAAEIVAAATAQTVSAPFVIPAIRTPLRPGSRFDLDRMGEAIRTLQGSPVMGRAIGDGR